MMIIHNVIGMIIKITAGLVLVSGLMIVGAWLIGTIRRKINNDNN